MRKREGRYIIFHENSNILYCVARDLYVTEVTYQVSTDLWKCEIPSRLRFRRLSTCTHQCLSNGTLSYSTRLFPQIPLINAVWNRLEKRIRRFLYVCMCVYTRARKSTIDWLLFLTVISHLDLRRLFIAIVCFPLFCQFIVLSVNVLSSVYNIYVRLLLFLFIYIACVHIININHGISISV